MTVRRTRWQPDTCGCVLEYEWDDAAPPSTRVHTPRLAEACAAHTGQTIANTFQTCVTESKLKNDVLRLAVAAIPTLEITDAQGRKALREDLYKWRFDANRVLHFNLLAGTPAQRQTLLQAIAAQLPANRAIEDPTVT